jgi:hypothetical protein
MITIYGCSTRLLSPTGNGLHYSVTMSKPVQHRNIEEGCGPITRYNDRSHDVINRCQTTSSSLYD